MSTSFAVKALTKFFVAKYFVTESLSCSVNTMRANANEAIAEAKARASIVVREDTQRDVDAFIAEVERLNKISVLRKKLADAIRA